jgi:hypothetical protein
VKGACARAVWIPRPLFQGFLTAAESDERCPKNLLDLLED